MASKYDTGETGDGLSNVVEEIKRLNITNESQGKERGKIKCPEWLKDCESPFKWHSTEVQGLGSDTVLQRTHEKLDDLKQEGPEFSLYGYVSWLKLVLHYYLVGEVQHSWESLTSVEALVAKENSGDDKLYKNIQSAVEHVTLATKAHLLFLTGKEEESRQMSTIIIPVKVLGVRDIAALYVMKADFFLYSGYEDGENIAVELSREAVTLDPTNPEWEFYLSKVLRQQRKEVPFSTEIPREEVKLLESAVDKSDDKSKYLVYLAQVYRECGAQAFRQYRNQPNFYNSSFNTIIQQMNQKALDYYKQALELNPEGPALLRRVGYGIMNLPRRMTDYDLAQQCLLKSVRLSENSITLHVLGTFYHRYAKDDRKALEYFEKTAQLKSHAGLCDMVRIKFQLDPEYNPVEDLEAGLAWEMKKKIKTDILSQLGGYFLFIRRNLLKSLPYFQQVLAQDPDTPNMVVFKSFFLRMIEPINLYAYIVNEALLFLENGPETLGDASNDNVHVTSQEVEDILDNITAHYPDLKQTSADPSLITNLLKRSAEIMEEDKKREERMQTHSRPSREGQSQYRGRGGGRGGRGNNREEMDNYERRGRYSINNQRDGSTENCERRGRYSITNQRERQPSEGAAEECRSERRNQERFQNRNQRNQNRGNWRQRSNLERSNDCLNNEHDQRASCEDNSNWRRRN